ncbi:hypothetical protein H2198_008805 [Neophaeococcomyces mojaviensis]|uniref:Uncharacterized protein n=1 Tax=Neophaeococcomyces mojaviensis TaxID=3383035 RepID=A0ACC2ZWV8_9EURO|nr:hypothetical protein H2198_008805 [Knufia sp. JES_112]
MAIPGARVDDVPPALPPPRHNPELDKGVDLAWKWQNEDLPLTRRTLAPIKPQSSLWGSTSQAQLIMDEDEDVEMDMELDSSHHAQPIARPPSQSQFATGTSIPTLTRRPPSSSGINQRLQGENPLARQNQNQSTHAYDKHLLLRIGKSNSPPGYARSSSKDDSILDQKLSIQTRDPNLLPRPAQESSSSLDPTTTWTTSPTSAISLTSKFSWHEHGMDPRSSFSEGTSQLFAVDPELLHSSIPRAKSSKPRSGSMQSSQDTRARSERDSYDSNMYTADAESLSDEASLRSLHMEDRPHRAVLHGTKRRALSPPIESNRAQRQDNYLPLRSPNIHGSQDSMPYQPYNARSLSSTASSTQHSSYASSNMISNPSSSMTSISSLSSIARMVPESSQHLSLPTSLPTQKNLSILVTPVEKPTGSSQQDVASLSITTNKVRVAPSRIGNYYICSCCLKKPKRFETEDQLRAHENEKQYTCAYCNNRFKNKNEAERHQNSLHVRRQSWSCSAVATYQAAFHPSAFSSPRNSATDSCGFCGEEFASHPTNWDERIDHLTNVHKFGECNSTKKFYRADHFRQHLKHSHAGRSGKWTNILENKCLREEAPSEPSSLSPTASEHSQSGNTGRAYGSLPNPTDAPTNQVEDIGEVRDET